MTGANNLNYYFISIILILSFSKGLLSLIGINEMISQLMIESLIVLLFFKSMFNVFNEKKIFAPGFIINISLIAFIFISYLLTHADTIKLVFFIRNYFVYYMFFYTLFNINLSLEQKDKITKLIIFLFAIQIIGSFIKLLVIGTGENIIGIMSIDEGSLATTMPLMAISYLLSNYLAYKKIKYILIILLFIGVGLMSNKMGILFYVIILYVFLIYIYSEIKHPFLNTIFFKEIFIGIVFLVILFVLFVSLNPRANPEHKVGGSVDIEYLIEYSIRYQTLKTKDASGVEGDGRFDAPGVALDRMTDAGLLNVLVGFGPGELVLSSYLKYRNPLLEKYKIGYGGRIGLVQMIMQIGIIGTCILLLFHILLYVRIKKIYDEHKTKDKYKIYLMTFLGFSLIYFLDFFTYSVGLLTNPALVLVYFYTYYYLSTYRESSYIL